MKFLLGIAGFVALLMATTFVFAYVMSVYDTDGGFNVWQKGTCVLTENNSNGTIVEYNYTDYCASSSSLREYYPANVSEGEGECAGYYVPAYMYGGTCVDGAIVAMYGDLNCDEVVDYGDVNPFTMALTSPSQYAATYPDCNRMLADINGDFSVDFGDINPFVELLS